MILASVPDAVWVALIGAGGVVVAAWLPTRKTRREIERRVGEPNGHGSLTEMVSHVIFAVAQLDSKIDLHEEKDEQRFAEVHEAIREARTR